METNYRGRYALTLTADDIKNPKRLGRDRFKLFATVGRLLPGDVGKQVWETSPGVYQMESDQQRDRRIAKGG